MVFYPDLDYQREAILQQMRPNPVQRPRIAASMVQIAWLR
jgi:hypothetical protein